MTNITHLSEAEKQLNADKWAEMSVEEQNQVLANINKGLFKLDYIPQLQEWILGGGSYEAFAGEIGVSINALKSWEQRYPQWMIAKQNAYTQALKHWESILHKGITRQEQIDAKLLITKLKAEFPSKYNKDNHQTTGNNTVIMIDTGINRDQGTVIEVVQESNQHKADLL